MNDLRRVSATACACVTMFIAACSFASQTFASGHAADVAGHVRYSAPSWIRPDAVHQRLLYVALGDMNHGVLIYRLPEQILVGELAAETANGVAVDRNGDVYVTLYMFDTNSVFVYHKGSTAPYKMLSDPDGAPTDIVIGRDGTVYVANVWGANFGPGNVVEYANGSTTPTAEITDPNFYSLSDVGLDSKNNLYVTYETIRQLGCVNEYAPGQLVGKNLNLGLANAAGIEFDSSDNIVVGDLRFGGEEMKVYSQKRHTLLAAFDVFGDPVDPAFTASRENVFVADYHSGKVLQYAYPSLALVNKLAIPGYAPIGSAVAVDPSR